MYITDSKEGKSVQVGEEVTLRVRAKPYHEKVICEGTSLEDKKFSFEEVLDPTRTEGLFWYYTFPSISWKEGNYIIDFIGLDQLNRREWLCSFYLAIVPPLRRHNL